MAIFGKPGKSSFKQIWFNATHLILKFCFCLVEYLRKRSR